MIIPLPPLPRPDAVTEIYTGHGYKDVWTATTVRARDQEIVRCVLEAAETACGHLAQADAVASIIRALEFHHE